jgi:hypothetical protein
VSEIIIPENYLTEMPTTPENRVFRTARLTLRLSGLSRDTSNCTAGAAHRLAESEPYMARKNGSETFQSIDSARTALSEMSSARPGHYVIFDQTMGEEVFAESNLKDSFSQSVRPRTQL